MVMVLVLAGSSVWADGPYNRRTPVVEAFKKNSGAVVNITSKHIAQVRVRDSVFDFWGFDDFPFHYRRVVVPSLGSGFVIDSRGYIVTNAHVVEGAQEIMIIMNDDKKEYQAKKIAANSKVDLALLKIEADEPLATVTLGYSDDLMIGETVLAIGNSLGYEHTLTEGVISAIHREIEVGKLFFPDLIQISAPINPGNSGGPLLNINGELIGINTAISKAGQGIGFAIPIDQLRNSFGAMLNIEKLRRMDFGLMVKDCKASKENQVRRGLIIESVRAGSAAALAGFRPGDIITAVDGKRTDCPIAFYIDMLERQSDRGIKFDLWRRSDSSGSLRIEGVGENLSISLTLRKLPEPDGAKLAKNLFGLSVTTLTERMIYNYNLTGQPGSVVVTKVERGSPGDNAGITSGDIIMAVDDEEIVNIKHLAFKLELMEPGRLVQMSINRGRRSGLIYRLNQFETKLRTRGGGDKSDDQLLDL